MSRPQGERPSRPLISAVVPFLNEAQTLPSLFTALEEQLEALTLPWELVLVDDGSQDDSLEVVRSTLARKPKLRATVLTLSRNFGKEAALTDSLQICRGDVVIPHDVELQDPPNLIGPMLQQWRQGYDVVYAVCQRRKGESSAKRLTAFGFYRLMGRLSSTSIPADKGDFRLMDRCVVEAPLQLPERSRFMKGLFAWVGFRQTAIYYERDARRSGSSSWNYWKQWNFALDGITSFSRVTLQVLSGSRAIVAAMALFYGSWMFVRAILFGIYLPGYASLITEVLFLGGVQLAGMGLLGEYLGRVFEEVKARPLHIMREKWEQR